MTKSKEVIHELGDNPEYIKKITTHECKNELGYLNCAVEKSAEEFKNKGLIDNLKVLVGVEGVRLQQENRLNLRISKTSQALTELNGKIDSRKWESCNVLFTDLFNKLIKYRNSSVVDLQADNPNVAEKLKPEVNANEFYNKLDEYYDEFEIILNELIAEPLLLAISEVNHLSRSEKIEIETVLSLNQKNYESLFKLDEVKAIPKDKLEEFTKRFEWLNDEISYNITEYVADANATPVTIKQKINPQVFYNNIVNINNEYKLLVADVKEELNDGFFGTVMNFLSDWFNDFGKSSESTDELEGIEKYDKSIASLSKEANENKGELLKNTDKYVQKLVKIIRSIEQSLLSVNEKKLLYLKTVNLNLKIRSDLELFNPEFSRSYPEKAPGVLLAQKKFDDVSAYLYKFNNLSSEFKSTIQPNLLLIDKIDEYNADQYVLFDFAMLDGDLGKISYEKVFDLSKTSMVSGGSFSEPFVKDFNLLVAALKTNDNSLLKDVSDKRSERANYMYNWISKNGKNEKEVRRRIYKMADTFLKNHVSEEFENGKFLVTPKVHLNHEKGHELFDKDEETREQVIELWNKLSKNKKMEFLSRDLITKTYSFAKTPEQREKFASKTDFKTWFEPTSGTEEFKLLTEFYAYSIDYD